LEFVGRWELKADDLDVARILKEGATIARFREWAGASPFGWGPREFPDVADQAEPLLRGSPVLGVSRDRQSASLHRA